MANKTKLKVEDLTISFRTSQGLVRAVRGVSFDLEEGETLAIVGESGSGKSVTSRAIMGILAGNGIIDGGSIMYEGQDLTKIHEEDFHRIRGDRIGMIFQDPMSSLNPIMKIGKQITEGMLINGKRLKNQYKKRTHTKRMDVINTKVDIKELKKNHRANIRTLKKGIDPKTLEYLKLDYNKDLNHLINEKIDAKSVYMEKVRQLKVDTDKSDEKQKADFIRLKQEYKAEYQQKLENIKQERDSIKAEFKSKTSRNKDVDNSGKIKEENKHYHTKMKELSKHLHEAKIDLKKGRKEAKAEVYAEWKSEKAKTQKKIEQLKTKMKEATSVKDKLAVRKEINHERELLMRFKKVTKKEAIERALTVMDEVGIPDPKKRLKQYPFQFSGGMRQRIVIAIALTANPDLLICDEPTTALDVTIQSQILELIKKLKEERNLSVIFITHDLGVVANMADRVAVMYAGKIVEIGKSLDIFYNPKHPYTWALLSSMPDLDSTERLFAIPGTPPNMLFPPKGDAFADRNPFALAIDFEKEPPFFKVNEHHYAATWLLHEHAPKVEMPEIVRNRIARMTKESSKEVSS